MISSFPIPKAQSTGLCRGYDIKQYDSEASVMLEYPLPSLPGPLWLGVVPTERVLSMGQIKLFHI